MSHAKASTTSRADGPSQIRVVRIIDRLNVGGPARHAVWLTSGLDPARFQNSLIIGTVPAGEDDMGYFASDAGVEPLVIEQMSREPGFRDLLVVAKLIGHLFRLKPDLVHTHKSKAGATGRIAALVYKWLTPTALLLRPRRCRVVHTYHGHIFHSYYGPLKTRLFLTIERALARCTDRIVTVSDQQRREICDAFNVGRPRQFRVIPLGIEFEEGTGAGGRLRRELGVADDEVLVGVVGRLCEVKNHRLFLNAAERLAREIPRLRFVIIGGGHLRDDLERQARELGVEKRLAFVGSRKDATALYEDLDIVALTSLNEGTPLTLIEAMNAARPIAATEVGGVEDILGDRRSEAEQFSIREHGVTAKSRDIEGFAAALKFLIANPDVRREMGARGQSFVRSRFSRERLIGDIEDLYYELTGFSPPEEVACRRIRSLELSSH